jgi:hypothetical protein
MNNTIELSVMPQERACHEAIYMLPDQVVPEAWASHEAIYMLPDQVVPEASVAQYAWQLVLLSQVTWVLGVPALTPIGRSPHPLPPSILPGL